MKRTLLACLLIPVIANAQKQTSLVIFLPENIQHEKLGITYYNGIADKTLTVKSDNNTILIREPFDASQVILVLTYPSGDPHNLYHGIYYINDQPAEIRLQKNRLSPDIFQKAILKNVIDARPLGADDMRAYTSKEMAAVLEAHKAVMASPRDGSLQDIAIGKAMQQKAKQFEYIRSHANQYYSFHQFGQGYLLSPIHPVDTMIAIFNRIFPAEYKNTWEGKEMMQHLLIRKLREQQQVAPDFTVKDIDGNTVSLQQFRNKYVLINFWASWCVPCVQEFPAIHQITDSIPGNKLVRIFISEDRDKGDFQNAVKKYDLKGIHLFADDSLITKYKATAIPKLYLIDKEGKIIYDRDLMKDYKLTALAELVKKTIHSQ